MIDGLFILNEPKPHCGHPAIPRMEELNDW